MNQYESVIFAEEGSVSGGFGEYASELALRKNCSCRILVLGVKGKFDALGTREELLQRNSLDGDGIADAAERFLLDRGESFLNNSSRVPSVFGREK
jgi:transketolase C-terminal domain/subunit